jgi:nucleoside phosphorylase
MPSTNSPSALNGAVDVLLICALKDEYDQVREVTDGLLDPGWVESYGPRGWIVADGRFATATGAQLSIRTTWAEHMGREQAQAVASFLIQAQPARCIAMNGICAGRRNKVALGDVIFAERLWSYDAGKMQVENGEQHFEGDPLQYRPRPGWVQRMQHLRISPDTPWLALRPSLRLEYQEDWILLRLLAGEDPRSSVDRKDACPDWDKALLRLWQRKWLKHPLTLTDLGRARAEELNLLYFGKLPAPAAFQTHIAPVATGAQVTEDTGIFPRLANSMRKVLGVEMEASALGALGELHDVPVVVAKGVSDYGDPFKDDRYRLFAARASAECLIALLRGAADLITIGDSIQAIDRMEPATPTPPAGPLITELPHHRPQQPTLSLASSGLVLRSNTPWTYLDWEHLIAQAHDAGLAFAASLTRSADCSEGRIGFEERVRHLIKSLRHLGHLPSVTPEHEPQLAVVCSKLERALKRALPPGAARRLEQGIIAVQELLNKEVLPLLHEIYLKADRQRFHAPAERRK